MSGLHGIVASRPLTPADLRRLEQNTNLLRHRGPDDEGYVLIAREGRAEALRGNDSILELAGQPHVRHFLPRGQSVALGARRLALAGPGAAAHLPLSDRRGNWLVLDGEIYNHPELREQLAGLGCRFRGHHEAEVVLHAYAQWDTACLEKFNGRFALALWDRQKRRLFCARDRFGEKPFYYARAEDGSFYFSSEIAPLRSSVRGEINRPLVSDFLLHGLTDHTPETFFEGIEQLPPGCFLKFGEDARLQTGRYYDLHAHAVPLPARLSRAAEQLRTHLAAAVASRLGGGLPLAGLVDEHLSSACIVALANQHLGGLNGHAAQNLLPAFAAAEAASMPTSAAALLEMAKAQEQPFPGPALLDSFQQLRQFRRPSPIKVVLTAEAGGDLLAGYLEACLPLPLLTALRWKHWLQAASAGHWRNAIKAGVLGRLRKLPFRAGLHALRHPVAQVLQPEFLRAFRERADDIQRQREAPDLNHRLVADITQFVWPQRLRQLDRNAMHWSLEARLPFLDHHVVEFACSLPQEWKWQSGHSQFILRQAMGKDLPAETPAREDKIPPVPAVAMHECLALVEETPGYEEFVDVAALRRHVRPGTSQPAYWRPLILALWLQTAFPVSRARRAAAGD